MSVASKCFSLIPILVAWSGVIVDAKTLLAELSLPHFFSDHMVLQRDRMVAIWGKADPNAMVAVSFKGKSAQAKADADGKWRVELASGGADSQGSTLVIRAGAAEKRIEDVVVGEVWFASGQSNMAFKVSAAPAYAGLVAESRHPGLRMFNAPLVTAVEPQEDIEGVWTMANPETIPDYSAVAFFFARKLHLELGIPVGVIKSAWGGKPVETFTSREALNTLAGTKALVDAAMLADAEYDQAKADEIFRAQLEKWKAASAEWKNNRSDSRGKLAKKPTAPKRPLDTEGRPGVLYNAMIHPFVGYTMRGAIWYQGEANAKVGAVPYDQSLPLMIRDWRKRWGDDFSFYFVQLANYRAPSTEPGTPDPWALLQDRMRRILATTPKTGMAIINDVGEANDIHPKNKKDPGERLALWALAKDYGRAITYSGPLYRSSQVQGNAIRVTFDQVGQGLRARGGGPIKRFEIAGDDRVWKWADATIEGKDSVLVRSSEVSQPVAVRYAWASNPEGSNLINSESLPASIFRTDDWDDVEPKEAVESLKQQAERSRLGEEIRALNEKRKSMDRKSSEYESLTKKSKEMMDRFKSLAPVK